MQFLLLDTPFGFCARESGKRRSALNGCSKRKDRLFFGGGPFVAVCECQRLILLAAALLIFFSAAAGARVVASDARRFPAHGLVGSEDLLEGKHAFDNGIKGVAEILGLVACGREDFSQVGFFCLVFSLKGCIASDA